MRLRLSVLAIALLCLVGASSATACSCLGPTEDQSIEDYVRDRARDSDGVVVARLLEVRPQGSGDSAEQAVFRYLIKRSYKHEKRLRPGKLLRIESPLSSATCGLPQREGRTTGMFLERFRGRWTSSLCSVVPARAVRDALGEGRGASRFAASGHPWCEAPGPGRPATGSRAPA